MYVYVALLHFLKFHADRASEAKFDKTLKSDTNTDVPDVRKYRETDVKAEIMI